MRVRISSFSILSNPPKLTYLIPTKLEVMRTMVALVVTVFVVMTVVQLALYFSLPGFVKKLAVRFPAIALVMNLLFSFFIISFTGAASIVGISNIGSSCIVALIILIYGKTLKRR